MHPQVWELGPAEQSEDREGRRPKRSLKNENKVKFSAMHVDAHNQEVLLVDGMGWLQIWNWVTERLVYSQPLSRKGEALLSVACNGVGAFRAIAIR